MLLQNDMLLCWLLARQELNNNLLLCHQMAGRYAESHLQMALLVLTLLTRETGRMTAGFRVESVTSGRERLEVARQILTEVPLIDG
jgi:hypothetical protein